MRQIVKSNGWWCCCCQETTTTTTLSNGVLAHITTANALPIPHFVN